jgi:hypothetical protein
MDLGLPQQVVEEMELLLGPPQQVVMEVESLLGLSQQVVEEMELRLLEVVIARLDLAWPYLMGCMLHMAD